MWNIFVHWFEQMHQSITASKENAVVFFQFEYAKLCGYVHFFQFRPQISFLGKIGSKNQNCQFILKFGTQTNSNMRNSMAMFNFCAFYLELPFLGKFGPKNQNCQFRLKFGTQANSNMQNSMGMFTSWAIPFWAYLVQKFKFVCSRKIAPQINLNIQNSMTVFFASV